MKQWIWLALAALLVGACDPETSSPDPDSATVTEAVSIAEQPAAAEEPAAEVTLGADQAAIDAAVNHPDRPETDKDRDAQRQPSVVLALAGARPGINALDVFTGGGYYGELLSRVVGPEGEVWVHNPPQFYEKFGSADIDDRLAEFRLPNVTRHDRPMDDLALPDERFDLVVAAMVFHDFYWLAEDVPGVLTQIHDAMRPGGVFLITDHAAPEGTGSSFAESFDGQHRIEEAHVVQLMREAGFELEAESDVLRVPEDPRTDAFFAPSMRGKFTDRFVLLFRKPA